MPLRREHQPPHRGQLDQVKLEVYDNDAAGEVGAAFLVCSGVPPGTACVTHASASTSGQPGWTYLVLDPVPLTIDNQTNFYPLRVTILNDGGQTNIRRALITYHNQVSSASAQTFTDVAPGDFGYQFIEALAASGITGGCGGGKFCPNATLTRAQMAIFLAKALGLSWPN